MSTKTRKPNRASRVRRANRRPAKARLQFEPLEERRLLSTAVAELNQFGDVTLGGTISSSTDSDRYLFAVDRSGSVQIDVNESGSLDPALRLWDLDNGVLVAEDLDGGDDTDDPRINASLDSWTRYSAEVFPEDADPGSYTITINGPTPTITTLTPDFYGDSTRPSENLGDNGDVDYYTFVAPPRADGNLTVTAATANEFGPDTVVSLYDSAGVLLARADDFTADYDGTTETFTITDAVPGETYTVRVGSKNYASSGDFSLSINFGTHPPTKYYYATDVDTGRLVQIDPDTGQVATVGTPLSGATLSGLALTKSGALYGLVGYHEFYGNRLCEIDRLTGVATEVGPIGLSVGAGMGYDPATDRIYTTTATGGVLVRISKSTGQGTTIGSGIAGLTAPSAAAFDTTNNRLIVFDNDDDEYYAFDPSNGAATRLSASLTALNTNGMTYAGSRLVVNNTSTTKTLRYVYPDSDNSYHLLTPSEPLTIFALEYVADPAGRLLGIDYGGTLYDVGHRTGAATNARSTGIDDTVGVAFADDHTLYTLTSASFSPNPNSLFTVDRSTGAATRVGPTGLTGIYEGDLDFDPTTGTLYGIRNTSGSSRQLFTLSRTTGAATIIGTIGTADYSAMAFDDHGRLYVLDSTNEQLLRVNKATAAITSTVNLSRSLGSYAGMDFDPETGILFIADTVTDALHTVNTSTGKVTPVGRNGLSDGLSGLAFVPINGAIRGKKFNDADGDGRHDIYTEIGLSGWEVFLDYDQDGAVDPIATTIRSGPAWGLPDQGSVQIPLFVDGLVAPIVDLNVAVSIYHPRSLTSGYLSLISPSGTQVNLLSALVSGGFTFDDEVGNAVGLLSDFDGEDPNGMWYLLAADSLPDGFAGQVIAWSIQFTHGEQVATTDAYGNYVFADLKPDTYTVAEVQQDGWIQTFPWSPNYHRISLDEREVRTGVNFGNFRPAEIHGTKWFDADADGTRDAGELGLPDWEIFLDYDQDGSVDPIGTTTLSAGGGPMPDTGTVAFPLAVSGLAAPVTDVTVALNMYHPQAFLLDAYLVSPGGTRVELFSPGRLGIGGNFSLTFDDEVGLQAEGMLAAVDGEDPNGTWTLWLTDVLSDGNSGAVNWWSIQFEHGEQVVTTDANGDYAFTGLKPGTYNVREVIPPEWTQTSPGEMLEDFDDDTMTEYVTFGAESYAVLATGYAHDGRLGLAFGGGPGEGWLVRDDPQARVAQGDLFSMWIKPGTYEPGRAHFAFGATGSGALSAVLAWDTNELLLENNAGFGHVPLAAVPQTYLEYHWYRLEVTWGSGGPIAAGLYDSDGTTLLNTVAANDNSIAAGGIGFGTVRGGDGSVSFWDTVIRAGRGGNRAHTVVLRPGEVVTGQDFGNYRQDFGDAPNPYPTRLTNNGARHVWAGPTLGPNRDAEPDGQPTAGADGDDTTGTPDDEDGVSLPVLSASDLGPTTASVTIDLQNAAASANRLDAWIDLNQDGDWNDPGEQVFSNYNLGTTSGTQTLAFTVPQDTGGNIVYGTTFARFRLSTAGGLLPTGPAADGEVEDYQVSIVAANHPPVLDPIGNRSVEEGILLQFTVTAGDPDDYPPDKVTLSASGLPTGATFTPATGMFAWTPGAGQQGEYLVTFTATDYGTPPLSDFEVMTITVTPPTLHVADAAPTVSGFFFRFNRPLYKPVLNLYDGAGGTLGPADLIVTDGSGKTVRGSMVVSDDGLEVEFVKTGGVLGEGVYNLTLKSGANGFRDVDGLPLDGNHDGIPGDDYKTSFTVTPFSGRVLSIPDFARGAGQLVDVPHGTAGLPIRVDRADGTTSIELLIIPPPSLQIIAILNPGLPEDWIVSLDTSTHGVARVTASGTTALSGTDVEVVRLRAEVPSDAPYGAVQAIRLENVSLNGAKIAAIGDVAVYKEVYPGDADGSGIHSSADAFLTVQAALGLASGFAAHKWTDPLFVGDVDLSGVMSAADAFLIVQEGLGLSEPFIPDNPGIGVTPVGGGVDPQFQIDVNVPANAGGPVTVPVKLDVEAAATNVGAFDFDLRFDPARLTIRLPEGVSAGADTSGWAVSATLAAPGQLRVGMVSASGRPLAIGVREIARLQFRVAASVPDAVPVSERPGYVAVLDIEPVDARAGGYTWTGADGSLLIQPTLRAPAVTQRERVWRDLDARAELLDGVLADLTHEIASAWR